jgi:arylsulfatase A-like enzyme
VGILAAALLLVAGCGGPEDSDDSSATPPPVAAATPPRGSGFGPVPVIIYVIDTLRTDRLGLYGYSRGTSPQIDALAAESVVFDQAYAPAPWTLPSVASLFTSTFPCEHEVLAEKDVLDESLLTLGEVLRRIGYRTAAFSTNVFVRTADLSRGFDVYKRTEEHLQHLAGYLVGVEGEPTYLYIHTLEPHNPYLAPNPYVERFGSVTEKERRAYKRSMIGYRRLAALDWSRGRPVGTTDNTTSQNRALYLLRSLGEPLEAMYDGAVLYADVRLGQIIGLLRNVGLWEYSVFVLVADHGEEFGDHGGWLHDQSVYEELMHVPLLIRFPGGQWGGRRIGEPVSLVDLKPTILDAIGRPELCGECRGRSLLPAIEGETTLSTEPVVTGMRWNVKKYYRPWKESRGDVNVVVRQGSLKGIWNLEPGTMELYDLAADPGERSNLAESRSERVRELMASVRTWYAACREQASAHGPRRTEELDADTLEEIRSLGYVP